MANISILMLPEPGHYMPTLRIARALQQRGHSVCYFTIPQYTAFFANQGFRCQPILLPGVGQEGSEDLFAVRKTGAAIWRQVEAHLNDLVQLGNFLLSEIRQEESDLLILDTILSQLSIILANGLQKPVVMLSTSLVGMQPELPFHQIVLCPQELEIPSVYHPVPLLHHCEPSICRERPDCLFPWDALSHDKPIIYCSLGTQVSNYAAGPAVLRAVAEAFKDLASYQLVLAAGTVPASQILEQMPPNVLLVKGAPQVDILARAQIAITHGGLGTIKEAIMASVPLIVIPFHFDQPSNGKRVEYHRLGRTCLPAECSPDKIRQMVLELSVGHDVRANIAAMCSTFWAREAEAPAVKFLTEFISGNPSCDQMN